MINIWFILFVIVTIFIILIFVQKQLSNKNSHKGNIRDVILSPEELEEHAIHIAHSHIVGENRKWYVTLIPRMNENYRLITEAYKKLNEYIKQKKPTVAAAEWLLDNYYIIERQIKEIHLNIPKNRYAQLPILKEGSLKGYPRVYGIVQELVAHTDGQFDENTLIRYIESYQSQNILSSAELWSISIMIRIALIENIRRICQQILYSQQEFLKANKFIKKILAAKEENSEGFIQIAQEELEIVKKISSSYAEYIIKELKKQDNTVVPILEMLDEKLAAQGTTPEDIIKLEHQKQAASQISIGNSITSLRLLSALDWSGIFESLSKVEKTLREDPAEIYAQMDFESRDYYRHVIDKIAKDMHIDETQVAKKAVECAEEAALQDNAEERAKHVGYYLIGKGSSLLRKKLNKKINRVQGFSEYCSRHKLGIYLSSILFLTILITSVFFYYTNGTFLTNIWVGVLACFVALIQASDIAVHIVHRIITHVKKPALMPKMEFTNGIPEENATMVVIPTLLPNVNRVKELISQLEVFYLANKEKNLYFALVGDFKDASQEVLDEDQEIINAALDEIKCLNEQYAEDEQEIFYFCHRHRQYNEVQEKWLGWERKRGALIEFNDLLLGSKKTSFSVVSGDLSKISKIKYVITLDADTNLPRNAAKKLIGTMAHPLHKPIFDHKKGRVVEGYGLLQPRIDVSILSSNKTLFSRIFAGQGGIDPYTTAVSDVYQDLFGEGIFTGKGIYDVEIFQKALKNSIPDNTVLSHDLLEGSYVRVGLVTDIHLIDGYPSRFNAYIARLHRWVRGDWQLVPWLKTTIRNRWGKRVQNPISTLSKWKILDNLRRSLVSPAIMLSILFGFMVESRNSLLWLGFSALTLAFPIITGILDAILAKNYRFFREKRHCTILYGWKATLYQIFLMFVFLPYHAYMMLDAIVRTLIRITLTKKNTLEWVTAADVEKNLKNDINSFWRRMWISPVIAIGILGAAFYYSKGIVAALVLFIIWVGAPWIAYKVSVEEVEKTQLLNKEDVKLLRLLSRKTWRYFEDFVTEEDHYLPPDNYQEDPPNGIAHRTSPTNIGLFLTTVLAARDFGYVGLIELKERLLKTINTVNNLEKWKGHLYNWYNTQTLEILRPRYISTVDSGNLVGYLMTLRQGLKELLGKELADYSAVEGLLDTINLLKQEDIEGELDIEDFGENDLRNEFDFIKWKKLLCRLLEKINQLENQRPKNHYQWLTKVQHMAKSFKRDLDEFVPWLFLLDREDFPKKDSLHSHADIQESISSLMIALNKKFSLNELQDLYKDIHSPLNQLIELVEKWQQNSEEQHEFSQWINDFKQAVELGRRNTVQFLTAYQELIKNVEKISDDMNLAPLFDKNRMLFSIGYNVEDEKLTKSYYDLMASEARQASYIAIAKGEVDQKHWERLGRSLTMVDGYKGLVSWTGTMFEYLMPLLIMKNYKNTLWDESYALALRSQKKYGRLRNVPWGTSESGYYAFDIDLNYQYKAFGVPELGLKRGLSNDMVVAPYASVMALMVDPIGAVENIKRLIEDDVNGLYGLYEAIDYTPSRIARGEKRGLVKSYMIHHQGMSMMALVNCLYDNIMQKRFHADPVVKSAELLLQERVPVRVILTKQYKEKIEPLKIIEPDYEQAVRKLGLSKTMLPNVHILSNGSYSVMLTDGGSGYSKNQSKAVTRWRDSLPVGNYGMFFYIQNINSNNVWSATYAPYYDEPENHQVVFTAHKAEFMRKDGNIDTHTEIVVSPEDHAEVRRISLTNHSEHTRTLEVTSYFEVVLTEQAADEAHPAFNNLFVRTEFIPEHHALIANRRPREEGKNTIWAAHTLFVEGKIIGDIQYETDRAKFIGRGRSLSNPRVMEADHPLSNTVGPVLDPIMSIRCRVRLEPGETARVAYITGISEKREEILRLAEKYQDKSAVDRAFELAWTRSRVESKYLGITDEGEENFQNMMRHILFTSPIRRKRQDIIQRNVKGQSGLWAYGISGDLPIMLVSIQQTDEIEIVQQALKAHEYWRMKGLHVDLVILNEDMGSYTQPLQDLIRDMVSVSHARYLQDQPGGVFVRAGSVMADEDKVLLFTVAKLVLKGDGGALSSQIYYEDVENNMPNEIIRKEKKESYKPYHLDTGELIYHNGWGGFSTDGKEYIIYLDEEKQTPAPWSNVISNHRFGFLITESGGGYTWSENSRENKLTPWYNDPITDPNGEIFYLRDEDSGEVWSVTPLPIREKQPYKIRHGYGYSIFEHYSHGINQELTLFVPRQEPVKLCILNLENLSDEERTLTATYYIHPVLGVNPQLTEPYIVTEIDEATGVLLIKNPYNTDFPGNIVFMDVSEQERTFTGDRLEFLGFKGEIKNPDALKREKLSNRVGAGYNPCGAIQVNITLNKGEEKKVVFMLGQSKSLSEIQTIAHKYRDIQKTENALKEVKDFWNDALGVIKVKTPDQSMDLLMNGWLLYQVISCRIWGRSAFYQSGGAYGFRDQLQDVMSVVYVLPELTYSQILRHAAHQFVEGDVQHWWHPIGDKSTGTDKGVRTKFSDDLVWLPYVTADYINKTQDWSILDQEIYFIEYDLLGEDEDEKYIIPRKSNEKASIYEHCVRAIDKSLKFGEHGIPLMGSGDWNDGMSTVGNKGKGESVWLGWFIYTTLSNFIPICKKRQDKEREERYKEVSKKIIEAIEEHAWDGSWYRRAYFDDGTPMGSAQNTECKIDSLSQSWSVISGAAKPHRSEEAMKALEYYLVKREEGLIMLLTPPFDQGELKPGYIKGYVPGVRENGGQYTHAAIWVILAFAKMGYGNKAWELFNLINPINHARTSIEAARYKVEPYVMAADVYAVHPNVGRGGWTWYTGAAGWMYRVGIEYILGLKKNGEQLSIDPCIPQNWEHYSIEYTYMNTKYTIEVQNPEKVNRGVKNIKLDGKLLENDTIQLLDDGQQHKVEVIMG